MTAQRSLHDEPFFREWAIARSRGEGTSAVSQRGAERGLVRSHARSRIFRDLLGLERSLPVPALAIVGSKGKGTAVAAASFAIAQSRRVGTVTSPPFRHNRERIRVDGRALADDEYAELSQLCAQTLERMPGLDDSGYLSPSGLFTLTGIAHLLGRGVEALVVEEGLGGLSDEVSHFDYDAVVLTQVFAEHTEILGGSLATVAHDLVGTATSVTRTVWSYPEQPPEVHRELAAWTASAGSEAQVRTLSAPAAESIGPVAHTLTNLALGEAAGTELVTLASGAGEPAGEPAETNSAMTASSAFAHGGLRLPGRGSTHTVDGRRWIVDAAISAAGVRQARARIEAIAASTPEPSPELIVLACFPDTKEVAACLGALAGLHVVPVLAGTDYLTFDTLRRSGFDQPPLTVSEALASLPVQAAVLAVGTMSFAGEVIDALGIDVDAWWD